ncbi:hypothetical protein DRZ78_01780 [Candidatus Aerophobetes bacterium]|uniref:Uncharacterized protein n=1 Tax=Aerophobetes bacterium TaxID=2030807 RepID=A0A662D4M9_UNCAE|nr:MAG: hypothetical protein DRZ78_01780 [Candidatus Aerophobetes bacterium]
MQRKVRMEVAVKLKDFEDKKQMIGLISSIQHSISRIAVYSVVNGTAEVEKVKILKIPPLTKEKN